mmetsp:Transcript_28589/g.59428  ORF Transcript_28589/g.59428 Transcript_28589/m.59428 type:complete len:216 (-) Transcript_28589:691-1338(-)
MRSRQAEAFHLTCSRNQSRRLPQSTRPAMARSQRWTFSSSRPNWTCFFRPTEWENLPTPSPLQKPGHRSGRRITTMTQSSIWQSLWQMPTPGPRRQLQTRDPMQRSWRRNWWRLLPRPHPTEAGERPTRASSAHGLRSCSCQNITVPSPSSSPTGRRERQVPSSATALRRTDASQDFASSTRTAVQGCFGATTRCLTLSPSLPMPSGMPMPAWKQ